jgi:membrane-bound lytic murein transglycosylase A
MNTNPSYVFFRRLEGDGPVGAQGVALTPGRSLAVDRTFIAYGVPVWLDAEDPLVAKTRIRRLMVAQDTGGAIRGPVRGDVFWGHGDEAEQRAGLMKSNGRYWLLLPKGVTPPAT